MTRKNNPQGTRQKIIEVSAELFMMKGYENTSMINIIEGVGKSSGAVFHHFKTKLEILDAVLLYYEDSTFAMLKEWLDELQYLNGRERIIELLMRSLDSEQQEVTEIQFVSLMRSPQIVVSSMISSVNRGSLFFAELLRQGIEDGSITCADPERCAQVFTLLYNTWTDQPIFAVGLDEIKGRLQYLQLLMKNMGADIVTDEIIEKNMQLIIERSSDGNNL